MQQNPLERAIDSINKMKDTIDTVMVKEDINPIGAKLYSKILDSSIDMMSLPSTKALYKTLEEKLGTDATADLIEMIIMTMTHSSYQSVVMYDELLKEELDNNFKQLSNYADTINSDVRAHRSVLEVFKKRLADVEHELKLEKIKKAANK